MNARPPGLDTGQSPPEAPEAPEAARAAAQLASSSGADSHDIALVLGSGWAAAATRLGEIRARVARAHLEGFRPAAVAGHSGEILSVTVAGGRRLLVFGTRTHLYEGHGAAAVAHPVRTAAAAGCRVIILTNGCGSIRPQWRPGTAVLIADHLNLTGMTALVGPEFVDCSDLYARRLRAIAHAVDPDLPEGVYAQFPGPQYETPAEVRMAAILGADLVGMSTTIEAVAARAAGLDVLGLSLVTNSAAGVEADQKLDHADVMAAGGAAADRCSTLLKAIVDRIAEEM